MKNILFLFGILLPACRLITPTSSRIESTLGEEFTLAPGQSAHFTDADITITLVGVPGDQRCPLKIECAISGPVNVSITVQLGSDTPQNFDFTTFTDNDGSVPSMDFQGMQTRVDAGNYVIQVKSVLPYPQRKIGEIKDSQYRVSFVVEMGEH